MINGHLSTLHSLYKFSLYLQIPSFDLCLHLLCNSLKKLFTFPIPLPDFILCTTLVHLQALVPSFPPGTHFISTSGIVPFFFALHSAMFKSSVREFVAVCLQHPIFFAISLVFCQSSVSAFLKLSSMKSLLKAIVRPPSAFS